MLDALSTAEIQALRLKLQLFASRQTDQTVRSQCLAVDARLAEVLEGDDPILRQLLVNSVEQLEKALRWATRWGWMYSFPTWEAADMAMHRAVAHHRCYHWW